MKTKGEIKNRIIDLEFEIKKARQEGEYYISDMLGSIRRALLWVLDDNRTGIGKTIGDKEAQQ